MCIVWEGKRMRRMLAILRYEYKMQFRRWPTFGAYFCGNGAFPSGQFSFQREFGAPGIFAEPAYFVYRIMSLDSLVLLFGLMFLLAGRFPLDAKTE